MTAEFAAAMPAVVLLLACCLAAMQLASGQIRLQDAAATVARSISRGGTAAATTELLGVLAPAANIDVHSQGELICVRLTAPGTVVPGLSAVTLSAFSCALSGGR